MAMTRRICAEIRRCRACSLRLSFQATASPRSSSRARNGASMAVRMNCRRIPAISAIPASASFDRALVPHWPRADLRTSRPQNLCQVSDNGADKTEFRVFAEQGMMTRCTAKNPTLTRRASISSDNKIDDQAASSWISSPSGSTSPLARRGDFARLCSISLSASVSVMRFTAEISRTIRSRAAS